MADDPVPLEPAAITLTPEEMQMLQQIVGQACLQIKSIPDGYLEACAEEVERAHRLLPIIGGANEQSGAPKLRKSAQLIRIYAEFRTKAMDAMTMPDIVRPT